MKRALLLAALLCFLFTDSSFSLPRFSMRSGSTCNDCHVNPTGGQLRTDRGWNMSRKGLTMTNTNEEFEMSNRLGKNVLLGLDFRGQLLQRTTDSTSQLDFQRMSASMYANIDLSEELKIYGRYDYLSGIWEGYGIAHILPNNGYIKGGTFTPNFGWRIDDHTAYTRGGDMGVLFTTGRRQGNIFDPNYTESGVEVGVYLSDYAFITGSVGNPRRALFVSDPSYTVSAQLTPLASENMNLLVGGSAMNFKKPNATFTGTDNVWMYAGFAGLSIGEFTLLAEMDFAKSLILTDSMSTAVMLEASYRLLKGVEAIVRYDRFDPLTDREKNDVSRVVLGFELFPYSFIEIRPQYRIQMEEPSVKNNSLVVQMHLYY